MSSTIADDPRKPLNAVLLVFALVGFLASVVTVVQFLKPQDSSSLEVDLYAYEFRTPHYSGQALQAGEKAREVIRDFRRAFCKDLDEQFVLDSTREEISASEQDAQKTELLLGCKDFTEIEFGARWVGTFSASDGEMLRYEIRNAGTKVADDIRIKAEKLNSLQYKRGGEYVDVKKTADGEYYNLPALNPNEAVTILTWTNSIPSNLDYSDWDDFPRVTFAGSEVKTELYKPVTDGWYNLYEFATEAPIVLVGAIAVLASFILLFSVWMAIAVPAALVTGRPIATVFSDEQKAKIEHEKESS